MAQECIKCGSDNVKLKESNGVPYYECKECGKKFAPGDKRY